MTNQERWAIYNDQTFRDTLGIQLLDWAGYWAAAGLDEITDPLQKAQTARAIEMIVQDLNYAMSIVASLVISDAAIKAAEITEVTEQMIYQAMVSVMANELEWVTGLRDIPEQ